MKNFVSNKDESARMFQSDLLEMFTHVHPAVPVIIFVPVVAYALRAGYANVGTSMQVSLYLAGLFVWSFIEYVLHREVFHLQPQNVWGRRLHFIIHGVHHDYPNDSRRLVMPPAVSIPLAIIFYLFFREILGRTYVPTFFAGFITGYLCYDMTHYAIHHWQMKGRIGHYLRKHHFRHHYLDMDANYGVSSPIWDVVFGTLEEKDSRGEMAGDLTKQEGTAGRV